MTVTTLTGAQVAILNSQGQKAKTLRRILKSTAPSAYTFDKGERVLPFIENQLYTKPFQVIF